MTTAATLLNRWAAGEVTYGAWCVVPSTVTAQRVAMAEVDYVCVDQQHGAIGYSDATPMFQVIAPHATPITRVSWNDPGTIMKALDAGAQGVVVPLVSTGVEAAAAVAACRYPPNGIRSYGPVVAGPMMQSRDPRVLERVACIVMVETLEGLDNLEDIVTTPGVDAVYVGPADLALTLDLPPAYEHDDPRHAGAITAIREACSRHGVVAGIHCADGDMAARRVAEGFQMVTVAQDLSVLVGGVASAVAAARGEHG